jgi:serine/threonine protein kinase
MSSAREPAADLPALIGKYRIKARLGEGATSEVFLAHDPFHQREVAIKRTRPGTVDTREQHFQQRFFEAEAALVGRLNHPNVVQIHDAVLDESGGGSGGGSYLVMEVVRGPTLRRYCRPDLLLPLATVIDIGFKCAMALGYCFRQGLIHRDVKPANLLAVMDDDRVVDVKVGDFGSAFNLRSDATQVYRVGSLAYMSPEQLDGTQVDARADIYSLAAVLYHLLAGRPPHDAQQQQAVMHQIFNAEPPPLAELRQGLPPRLLRLIETSLSKNREQRPADWDTFAGELSALASDRALQASNLRDVLDAERFTLLRSLEFFQGFGDVELWEVVHRARWERMPFRHVLFRKGDEGNQFHIVAQGRIEVWRDGAKVASLGVGTSVGEMAYLAPSPELKKHTVDILVAEPATTLGFTPETMEQLSLATRHLFDAAFIGVLVRRLHAAHEALAHPRKIL